MVGISDHPHKMFKKSLHRKNDSEEIDVFEAAKYFSATNEAYSNTTTTTGASKFSQKKDSSRPPGARLSLDMPMRNTISSQAVITKETQEKKHKQPSSPGGKLANFLNSIFNQTSLKKMKSKAFSAKSVKDIDDNESPGWRRKRRSSISNFQFQSSNFQTKPNTFQSSNSGFRTPPATFAQTTPNGSSYKEFRSYSDHKEISPFSYKNYGNLNPSVISIGVIKGENLKHANKNGFGDFRKFTKPDNNNGSDSDSSSDLFDLPNCDLDLYSSGLPVYETTHIDSLKMGAKAVHPFPGGD